jgi:hypothetical protein
MWDKEEGKAETLEEIKLGGFNQGSDQSPSKKKVQIGFILNFMKKRNEIANC